MTDTINNGIPLVPENTIDPAAGLNEALNVADALIQVDVISLTVTAPPASPAVGDRYIVPTGATGAWAGQAGKLARWEEGLFWAFYNAQFVTNNGVAYTKTSGGWAVISGSGEANTTSNLGTGEGIAAPKAGVNLPFKSLKAGANVTITSDANEITISSAGGGGGSAAWGGIGGDIEDQADLQTALDEKEFELVAGTNITINRSNPKAPVISASGGSGGGGQVDSIAAGEGITVDNTDPENPAVSVDFSVAEYKLTAGANITIDRTDPDAPVISATGGGGSADWGDIGGDIEDQADLMAALAEKQATLVSGTNIKAINGDSLLGSGDLATTWLTPTLVNGWTTFPGYQSPQYKKIGRLVYVRGMVQNPSAVADTIFALPTGFRPPADIAKGLTYGNLTGTFLTVTSSGNVSTGVGAANSALPVDFIFEVAP